MVLTVMLNKPVFPLDTVPDSLRGPFMDVHIVSQPYLTSLKGQLALKWTCKS